MSNTKTCKGCGKTAPKKEPKDAGAGFVHPGTPTLWLCECCGARAEGFFDDPPPKGWEFEPSLLCPECAGGYDFARKFQEETERWCSCPQLLPGLDALHRSCKMAAMNGTPIKLPDLKYCPWCGGRLVAGQRDAENEKAEEKTEAPTAPALSDTCCICEGKIKTCPHGTATRVKICHGCGTHAPATPVPEPFLLHPDDPEGHLNKLSSMTGGGGRTEDGWETAPDYRGGHLDICPQCLNDTRDLSPKSQALREKIWGHHMYFFCSACNRTMGCPSQVFPPPGWRMTKDHKCYCPRHSALQPDDATSLLKEVVAEIEAFKWGNPDKLRLDTVTGRIGLALELAAGQGPEGKEKTV